MVNKKNIVLLQESYINKILWSKKNKSKTQKKGWSALANWLIDVSKYLMTGVILSSVFKDIENKFMLYTVGLIFSIAILIVGILIKNKEE